MEKKNKKKLFAIIGGSVLAFVLTIALSVSITLAYFGASDNAESTLTMGQPVTFDGEVTATASVATVLPGATGTLTVNGKIAQSTTKAFVRMTVAGGTGSFITLTGTEFTVEGLGKFVKAGTGNYYYLADSTTPENMAEVNSSAEGGKAFSFALPYEVDETLKNTDASQPGQAAKTVDITVTVEIIQSDYIGAGNAKTVAAVAAGWEAIDAEDIG